MCGLTAIVDPRVSLEGLHASAAALRHRGPDGKGFFVEPSVGLGFAHARLAIVDLKTGDQPLTSADDQVVLVCNGEIYDFEAIRARLEREGHKFKTKSDSEVILALYLRHGLALFEHLRGEFAFALFDRPRRRLLVARDRFGIKPLFFTRTDRGGWIFSSEMKGIFATGLVKPELTLGPHTIFAQKELLTAFKSVRHLAPGTAIVLDLDAATHQVLEYWKPNFPTAAKARVDDTPLEVWTRRTDELLTEAIRLRLRADVPVGLYLSGGVDSAIVAAKVRALAGHSPLAFTIAFREDGGSFDEEKHARVLADHIGVVHHVLPADRRALWDNLEECIWHVEGPMLNLSPVGKFLLSGLARQHVKVVLTGEGADEVFLGYGIFRDASTAARRATLSARKAAGATLMRVLWPAIVRSDRDEENVGATYPSCDRSQLDGRDPVVQLQYQRLKNNLLPHILAAYGDRTEMAHSIEGRLPFLDHHLFEMARDIPTRHKIHGSTMKYVLRTAAAPLLPKENAERPKWAFATRTAVIERGLHPSLDRLIDTCLSRSAIEEAGLFRWRGVEMLQRLRAMGSLRAWANGLLFYVLCYQILHKRFVAAGSWR